jgi:general stress protein YciG
MKYSLQQRRVYEAYDEAREKGGAMVSGYWQDFDELPVPEGYTEDWAQPEEEPEKPTTLGEMNDNLKKFLEQNQAPKETDDWKEYFRQQGRLGGMKGGLATKQRGREYYSKIGKMGGRGKKKMVE